MTFPQILTVILSLSIFTQAMVQSGDNIQSTAQCQANFVWAFNKQGLSPCFMLAALSAPCSPGQYMIQPLQPGSHYNYPNKTSGTVTPCSCSWAAYNLISACTACQGIDNIPTWPSYSSECGDAISKTTYWPSTFSIPDNYTIPFYAGTNPNDWSNQQFNIKKAVEISNRDDHDLTGAPTSNQETQTPGSPQKKAKPIGSIVGGTIGGVVFLGFLFLLCYLYRRRRISSAQREFQALGPDVFPHNNQNQAMAMYTHDAATQSFSQFGTASIHTTFPQSSPSHPDHSHTVPIIQTHASGPDVIEPFILTSAEESPESIAWRKASAGNGGISSTLQSTALPSQIIAAPDCKTSQSTPPGLTSDHAHRLGLGLEELEGHTSSRRHIKSQPPAYSPRPDPGPSTTLPYDVATARRELHGHGHRPSPGKGSQDSQTSWMSTMSGGVSDSTTNSRTPIQGQTREPVQSRIQRYHSMMSRDHNPAANVA